MSDLIGGTIGNYNDSGFFDIFGKCQLNKL